MIPRRGCGARVKKRAEVEIATVALPTYVWPVLAVIVTAPDADPKLISDHSNPCIRANHARLHTGVHVRTGFQSAGDSGALRGRNQTAKHFRYRIRLGCTGFGRQRSPS